MFASDIVKRYMLEEILHARDLYIFVDPMPKPTKIVI